MLKLTSLAIGMVAAFGISTTAVSFARQDASADNVVVVTGTAPNVVLARQGADNPPGDLRHGRGRDDGIGVKRQGADNSPGDLRHGRGRDDGIGVKRQGADNPPGDDRRGRGRGRDDGLNHG